MDKLRDFLNKYFYFLMSLVIAAAVLFGFSHTVDMNLIHATPARPVILWCHGIAFTGWLLFFILQSALVRTHNVKIHRKLGWFGLALGAVMVVLGYTTAVTMAKFHVTVPSPVGDQAAFLIVPFHDITVFAILFGLAIWYRKQPEVHRRLIFLATCVISAAGFGRYPWVVAYWQPDACLDVLVLMGVVRDLIVMKKVQKVYLWAVPLMLLAQALETYIVTVQWGPWMKFAHFLMR